jgi:YegS/Rv2252/BmrU family lipid kinase
VSAPLLIVNPMSAGGATGRMFASMRATVEARLGAVDVEMTRSGGHAAELARKGADEGRPLIVAVGGDGTFSETVNGILAAEKPCPVGLIGAGTGGDFRKTLGLEHRLDKYLDAIASGATRSIDVGKARFRGKDGRDKDHYFVNILSAGMGGLVDQYVATGSRLLGGTMAYFMASTKALFRIKPGTVRFELTTPDGKAETRELPGYMMAVCNGQYFGSGMHVAPMAKIDDGRFEVVVMNAPNKVAFAVTSQAIYDGKHLASKDVTHFSCTKVHMDLVNEEARSTFLLDVDGEPLGGLPLTVEVMPGAITLRG